MTKQTIKRECASCQGTGLYVGFAEHDGAAVVCYTCNGTGCEMLKIDVTPFTDRKPRTGVLRVYRTNPGIGIGSGHGCRLEDFGGIPYSEWTRGVQFIDGTEDRAHTCPAWFYQCADGERKPCWKECGLGLFSSCSSFPSKAKCWERWDREFGTKKEPTRDERDG